MLKSIFVFLTLLTLGAGVMWYSKEILKFVKKNWKFITVVFFAAIAAFMVTFI